MPSSLQPTGYKPANMSSETHQPHASAQVAKAPLHPCQALNPGLGTADGGGVGWGDGGGGTGAFTCTAAEM